MFHERLVLLSELIIAQSHHTSNKIDFATLAFGNYSTTEQNTGFKWIDGSAIYKKTINFGALPNATSKTVAHNISNLSYVVDYCSITTSSNDGVFRPMPIISPSGDRYQALFEFDATYIYCYCGGNYSALSAYITLYYTKSS